MNFESIDGESLVLYADRCNEKWNGRSHYDYQCNMDEEMMMVMRYCFWESFAADITRKACVQMSKVSSLADRDLKYQCFRDFKYQDSQLEPSFFKTAPKQKPLLNIPE